MRCRAADRYGHILAPTTGQSQRREGSKYASCSCPSGARKRSRVIQEYFDACKGTDEHKILAYYSDDVVIHLPTGALEGKTAVRDNFVRPFIAAFPGNAHSIRNLAHAKNLVAVEWTFEAVHKGAFAKIEATGKKVQVPGCSFYEYDHETRKIPVGRIYFDFATLLRQIGAVT